MILRWRAALGIAMAAMFASTPALADETTEDEARAHHRRGVERFDEGDFRLALVEFERAYEISRSYKILYNIGQVQFQLLHYAKARVALERYLAEGGAEIPDDRRAAVEKDLAGLRLRTARLTVESDPPNADLMLDDQPVGHAPLMRSLVDAGSVRLQASSPGYMSKTELVKLAGGDDVVVRIDLVKAAAAPSMTVIPTAPMRDGGGLSTPAVVGWITTGVLALGAVGTGIAAVGASSEYDRMRTSPIQGSSRQARDDFAAQQSLVSGLSITTDALIATAVVAGAVSLYFTLRSRPKPTTPRADMRGVGLSMEPRSL